MKTLNELFRLAILANELDNNLNAALRFSDPDGASGRLGATEQLSGLIS